MEVGFGMGLTGTWKNELAHPGEENGHFSVGAWFKDGNEIIDKFWILIT